MHSRNPYPMPTTELHGDVYWWVYTPFCGLIHVGNEPLPFLGFISTPQP